MSKLTFTPGDRVRIFPRGEIGTVADVPEISAQFAGFVPVIIDGHTKTVPCSADNIIVIEPAPAALASASDAEIVAELQRRNDAARETARVTAVEYLRETPKLATQATTVRELCRASTETGLPASALFEAWGIVTEATA